GDKKVVDSTMTSQVRLGKPGHLALYGDYNVLFPDLEAHAIRRVQSNFQSTPTTEPVVGASYVADVVDGPKATARLTGPFSVAADDKGIVYFGDFSFDDQVYTNSTIRSFDRNTATVSTVTGIPTKPNDNINLPVDGPKNQARFWFPIDMAYLKGKLYVVDSFANAVRGVDIASGEVKTVAGKLAEPGAYKDDIGEAARFNF